MEKVFLSKENKNAFMAIFYLIYIILVEKWLTLLIIVLVTLFLWTPFAIWWTRNDGGNVGYYVMSLIVLLPIISTSLILLPIIHQQIFSSSIKMRMEATGVSAKLYAISIITLFSLLLIAIFYFLLILFVIFFSEVYAINSQNDSLVLQFKASYSFINLLFLPAICIVGFVSVGVLISMIKINEILKGILILFLIFFTIVLNQGTINNIYDLNYALAEAHPQDLDGLMFVINSNVRKFYLLSLNPLGTMTYTFQTTINSSAIEIIGGNYNYETINDILNIVGKSWDGIYLNTQIIGCLYSFSIFGIVLMVM